MSEIIVQKQKVADDSEKGIKQCARKLKTKILSSLTQLFFFCTATPDHTKLFTPMCLLMKLEESEGLSATSLALYLNETLIFSEAFLIPSVSAFDTLWVRHSDRKLCALPI